MTAPLLQASIRSFTFHGESNPAVKDVEITVKAATLTSVLGGSGSGKSTLGRLLAGWLGSGDGGLQGRLALGGDGIPGGSQVLEFSGKFEDPRIDPSAWSRHVGYVPQDAAAVLSQVRATVAEELAFGLENRGVDPATMRRNVEETAQLTGISHLLARDPGSLSGGELRRLAIACTVITGPGLLILDDPLSSLDPNGAELIRKLITRLISKGTAVIVSGQVMDSLARSAGYCLVLDGGTVTVAGTAGYVMASRGLAESGVVVPAKRRHSPAIRRGDIPGPPALELRDVAYSLPPAATALERRGLARLRKRDSRPASGIQAARPVLAGVNLQVEKGQIVAITGPNGAGKTTLLRHLNGLLRPERGEVVACGRSIEGRSTGAISADVGLLFQNPRDQLFERTLLREVRFGLDRIFDGDADQRALLALGDVGLGTSAARHPYDLPASGQRLLTLATVLVREPAILALDEPTVGLDRHGLARLDAAVRAAAARGAAVVLVTHDVDFARDTAHRTLVLSGGRLREL